MNVHRGDIYYADLSPVVGSEQGGVRPVLIVQNDVGNRFSPTVIAAAITSQRDKTNLPTHIALHAERTGLQKDSIVLLEQVRTIEPFRKSSERRGLHFICVFVCTVQGAKARLRGHSEAGRTAQRLRVYLGFRRLLCPESQTLAGLCR